MSKSSRESGDIPTLKFCRKPTGQPIVAWRLTPFCVFLVWKLPGNLSSRGGPRTREFSTTSISASISRQLCLPHQFWQHDESSKGPLPYTTLLNRGLLSTFRFCVSTSTSYNNRRWYNTHLHLPNSKSTRSPIVRSIDHSLYSSTVRLLLSDQEFV